MSDRHPYAARSQNEDLVIGFSPVFSQNEWWNIPVQQAVAIAMRATNGGMNPETAREFFIEAVRQRGLLPLNDE